MMSVETKVFSNVSAGRSALHWSMGEKEMDQALRLGVGRAVTHLYQRSQQAPRRKWGPQRSAASQYPGRQAACKPRKSVGARPILEESVVAQGPARLLFKPEADMLNAGSAPRSSL